PHQCKGVIFGRRSPLYGVKIARRFTPTGYDIADSAAFFNKPSLGFTVHQEANEDGEEFVRITTWKVRDSELYGFEKGEIRLCFYPERMGYEQFKSAARYRSSK
ncbi:MULTISPECIES: hypothetical protein, partial [unclassified Mameliella]|uniref:hypothetical protein n=1 Tax=unclassified Mameliella TaxID=2630630 RepID=UPI00273D23C2